MMRIDDITGAAFCATVSLGRCALMLAGFSEELPARKQKSRPEGGFS